MTPELRIRDASFNPNCPACMTDSRHTAHEYREFHPLGGHGYTNSQGWTHPDLEPQAKGAVG